VDKPVKPDPRRSGVIQCKPLVSLAGVDFGAAMQAVVDVWGRPRTIEQRVAFPKARLTRLGYGPMYFGFHENRLFEVNVHRNVLPGLRFPSGLSFAWSVEKVRQKWGTPEEVKYNGTVLVYRRPQGTVRFHFCSLADKEPARLIAVRMTRAKEGR